MAIEIPGVDQELAAEIAESIIGFQRAELAKEFIDVFSDIEAEMVEKRQSPLSDEDMQNVFDEAKKRVAGGFEALCQLENMHDVVQFEIANF